MNALVLLGGGARGAYQAGAIKAFRHYGISIDIVCGSSVGAINAAAVAAGMADELEARWLEIRTLDVFAPRVDLWRLHHWQAIAKLGNPLVRLVRDEIQWDIIRMGNPKLVVETTNLLTGEHHVYDNATCTWRHLLASAAIPMIFSPVRIGDDYHVDGSLTQVNPLLPAIERGADTLYVIALTSDRPETNPPANLYEMAGRVLEIFLHTSLRNDLLHLAHINRLVEQGLDKAHRIVKAVVLYPSRELGEISSFLTFSKDHIGELIALGYEDACKGLRSSE